MSDSISYREGYKFQLVEDYSVDVPIFPSEDISGRFIKLTTAGRLTIRCDYAWDGPSGPTADTPDGMRGSLVHDALYALMREGKIGHGQWRAVVDRVFHDILLEDGMQHGRARLWYRGVQMFGEPHCDPSSEKPVLTAPVQTVGESIVSSRSAGGPWPAE